MQRAALGIIREHDIILSVRGALNHISLSQRTDAVDQITDAGTSVRSGFCSSIFQNPSLVTVFAKVGNNVRILSNRSMLEMVTDGVRLALDEHHIAPKACSVDEILTGGRTDLPVVLHTELLCGQLLRLTVAACDTKTEASVHFATFNRGHSAFDWVMRILSDLKNALPPKLILGIGFGGSDEVALILAKESLTDSADLSVAERGNPTHPRNVLRQELRERLNDCLIGSGSTFSNSSITEVKIAGHYAPDHDYVVALVIQSARTRFVTVTLDGSGPVYPHFPAAAVNPR